MILQFIISNYTNISLPYFHKCTTFYKQMNSHKKKHQAFGQQTVQQKLINFYIHLINNNCLSITSSMYEVTESYNTKLKKYI